MEILIFDANPDLLNEDLILQKVHIFIAMMLTILLKPIAEF